MKKTLIVLTFAVAAVGLAVNAAQPGPASRGVTLPSGSTVVPTSLPIAWDRPQAPFDDREMTPVETAGASRGD